MLNEKKEKMRIKIEKDKIKITVKQEEILMYSKMMES